MWFTGVEKQTSTLQAGFKGNEREKELNLG